MDYMLLRLSNASSAPNVSEVFMNISVTPYSSDNMMPAISGRSFKFYKNFALHREHSVFFPIEHAFSYYALFLVIMGTVFNITSFFIMVRKNIRKYACMRYLAVLSLVDLIVLYQWNLNTFFKYNLSVAPDYKDLEEISLFWCRYISYMAFSCLQLSSWILSLVSFDRVMILYSSYWKIFMQKPKRINMIILFLSVTIFATNAHILFRNGYVDIIEINSQMPNGSLTTTFEEHVSCYRARGDREYIFPRWERIHLALYNLVPFAIMLVCNSLICYNVRIARRQFHSTKSKQSNQKIRRMTFMLFLVTFSFMLLTLPSVVVHSFLREFLIDKPYRRVVNAIVNNLMHTSHACNFLLYVYSAPNFRVELMRVINNCRNGNNETLNTRRQAINTVNEQNNMAKNTLLQIYTKNSKLTSSSKPNKVRRLNEPYGIEEDLAFIDKSQA